MKRKLIFLVLALQSVWILGTVFRQEQLLNSGRVVLLETRPIDPRDLLRGYYVQLNYQISDIPLDLFVPPLNTTPPQCAKIYATLAPIGTSQFWGVTQASLGPLKPAAGEILVCGTSKWGWSSGSGPVHVTYGIEQFFVAEGTGHPRGQLTAQVVVSRTGQANLKDVLVDGMPYREAVKPEGP